MNICRKSLYRYVFALSRAFGKFGRQGAHDLVLIAQLVADVDETME